MDPINPSAFGQIPMPYLHPPPPPFPPPSSSFWTPPNVRARLKDLRDTIGLCRALQKELEMMIKIKEKDSTLEVDGEEHGDIALDMFSKFMKENRIEVEYQESLSLDAANSMMSKLRVQLEPFRIIVDEKTPWEEKSALKSSVDKMEKYKRNKLWRKRKRRMIAENLAQEREQFDQKDKEANEWRTRENAKDIAQRKVEKMKEIARLKEKEEKKSLQSELELVLIIEKVQELRKLRIEKLKKQGHFLPEEDDKFLDRVREAVEEEEHQLKAAADTGAAKDAIAAAEESRNRSSIQSHGLDTEEHKDEKVGKTNPSEQLGPPSSSSYDYVAQLPPEFYHYYHGSSTDLGTLIEVRRQWDAFIRPGGSRIPGHWVQPTPPADDVWASYLVNPRKEWGGNTSSRGEIKEVKVSHAGELEGRRVFVCSWEAGLNASVKESKASPISWALFGPS